jgi:hypothetical protein
MNRAVEFCQIMLDTVRVYNMFLIETNRCVSFATINSLYQMAQFNIALQVWSVSWHTPKLSRSPSPRNAGSHLLLGL